MMRERVVLVTGAARGIGRYIAHTFAAEGARLALADIESVDQVAGELRDLGAEAFAINADVTREDQVAAMASQVGAHFGRVDVLVNNAAIVPHFQWGVPRWAAVRDMEKAFWDRVIDTNLGGTFLCTKHVLPLMEEQGSGHIINLYGGGRGLGAAAYVISKEAIRYFTRFVAEEERGQNICVVVLSPGGAIACEWAPEEARQRMPGPELAGNRFVLAATVGMECSGHLLDLVEGRLVVAEEETTPVPDPVERRASR